MELAYLGIICLTLIILVTTVSGHVSRAKKHAAELKADVDKRQIESAFPAEKPEPMSLEQQAFNANLQAKQQVFDAKKKALDALLARREALETHITELRGKASNAMDKQYNQYRADALAALTDARKEQQELVVEQAKLLATMREPNDESQVDAPTEPVRVATGGPVAQRVDDPDLVHDAEPDEPEASRAGAA